MPPGSDDGRRARLRGLRPRFTGRLGVADVATVANAALGFCAAVAAAVSPALAARVLLLAAMVDAVDGILARRYGGSTVGPYLDSLADVASFGVAPAALLVAVAHTAWRGTPLVVAVAVGACFVGAAVVRLGLYTADDVGNGHTEGVPTTLAGTLLAAAVLAGVAAPAPLVGFGAVLTAAMVTRLPYPDLRVRDALVMGAVQALAVLAPTVLGRLFPRALLAFALAYTVLGPWFYRTGEGKR
ncbi:protein sorting system archaetidylserine synthase [Halarchaeum nitratireducens]|uniref:CDP-diacylglycerol--serine O-phosphatidyltransferase n=1 Tax=Halarchaeum nitratireducens TaxID=489913 RepID=A0A830GFE7_9EURY|nr:protein sorting system archaetidylserine synthase [Halarchaeum nitratireducens]GGN23415.1 CDP-diacylglycerol--serine O-phosphatidyltransferase [Halarchaeum nitratireducens]